MNNLPAKTIDLYLYLTKRDKKGIRILSKFLAAEHIPERLTDLSQLSISIGVLKDLEQIIYDSRMLWEPWIESASTYDQLKINLKKRGYTNIPMSAQPELFAPTQTANKQSNKKTMIQKST